MGAAVPGIRAPVPFQRLGLAAWPVGVVSLQWCSKLPLVTFMGKKSEAARGRSVAMREKRVEEEVKNRCANSHDPECRPNRPLFWRDGGLSGAVNL